MLWIEINPPDSFGFPDDEDNADLPFQGPVRQFKEAAKQVETENGEEAFDRVLKRVANSPAEEKPEKH